MKALTGCRLQYCCRRRRSVWCASGSIVFGSSIPAYSCFRSIAVWMNSRLLDLPWYRIELGFIDIFRRLCTMFRCATISSSLGSRSSESTCDAGVGAGGDVM